MSRFRILLEMPFLCLFLAGGFTIGSHAIPWSGTTRAKSGYSTTELTGSLEERARHLITTYCSACHQSGRSGIDFDDQALELEAMRRDRPAWEQVVKRLRAHEMPPRKFPQPSARDRDSIISWIEQEVLQWSGAPGADRLMVRRLQRSEYVNTIRDLVGIHFHASADFPKDEVDWRHCGDVPEMSGFLMEKYRSAAEKLLDQATAAKLYRVPSSPDNARELLAEFTRRAYRKPADPRELDRLVALFERADNDGKTGEEGIKLAMLEVLTSPHFLYRIQMRDDPFALASRLSYFLWRSMPDEELLAQAEQGLLAHNLESQARRMLQDSRSRALALDFAAVWLALGKLDDPSGDDELLRQAMRWETEQFVDTILREDRSVLEFLDADYTFVNERLAEHYGIAGVRGEEMRRISLRGTPRGGLLTQASILTITSATGATSPVNRGKWVLENLLGAAPIRPPAGLIQALENTPTISARTETLRQRLEIHRSNPSCGQCHAKMDAIGLALENFDPLGAWRTMFENRPIEAIGFIPGGETVQGPEQLKAYLLAHREQFVRALGQALLRFSLGRKLDDRDRAVLDRIPEKVAMDQHRFSRVILEVINCISFQQGFGEEG